MDLAFMADSFLRLLGGVPLTLKLAFTSVALGLALALALVALTRQPIAPLGWIAHAYVFVFRGTPLLVQVFLIYYGLGQFKPLLQDYGIWWLFREPYYCALVALTLNTAAYTAEIVRGGLQSVRPGPSRRRGVRHVRVTLYWRIIAPLGVCQAPPAYGSEVILMIKATSLASTITLMNHRRRPQADLRELPGDRSLPVRRVHLSDDQLHHDGHIPAHRAMGRAGPQGLPTANPEERLSSRVFVADGLKRGRAGKKALEVGCRRVGRCAFDGSIAPPHRDQAWSDARHRPEPPICVSTRGSRKMWLISSISSQARRGTCPSLARGRDGAMLEMSSIRAILPGPR